MRLLIAALALVAAGSADACHGRHCTCGSGYGGSAYRLDYTPYRYAAGPSYHGPALYSRTSLYRGLSYGRPYAYAGRGGYGYPYAWGYGYRSGYGYGSLATPGMWYGYNRLAPYGYGYGSSAVGYGFGAAYLPLSVGYPYSTGYLNPHSPYSFRQIPVYSPTLMSTSPGVYGAYGYGY